MEKRSNLIIVAVDGSEQSYKAVQEANKIACPELDRLILLMVKDVRRFYGISNAGAEEIPALDRIAKRSLLEAARLVNPEITFTTKELIGNAKRKLVDFAREEKADLIVMGATGADFFEHLLLGSTTRYVIDHAPCDVLIVK